MAKLLNIKETRASRYFVSCIDLATRGLVFDPDAPQELKESVFLLNEYLRNYGLMDQPELIDQLKRGWTTRNKELSELTWKDYLYTASAVFTNRLAYGGMYEYTENCVEITEQLSNIMHMIKD